MDVAGAEDASTLDGFIRYYQSLQLWPPRRLNNGRVHLLRIAPCDKE